MALLNKLKLKGTVTQLLLRLSRETGFEKSSTGRLSLKFSGPEGDCHTGLTREADSRTLVLYKRKTEIRNVRQLTLLSEEELSDIAQDLHVPEIKAEWFGANIVIRGIPDLTLLPPSTRLQFPSNATVVVDMENAPCSQIAAVVGRYYPDAQSRLVEAATHKRGVTAWVEREGEVFNGDGVTVIVPPQRQYAHAS